MGKSDWRQCNWILTEKQKMQRSLCDFPTEIWYYYTFYNSCDDEQREYRCERRTKQVERIQAKPGNDHEQIGRAHV